MTAVLGNAVKTHHQCETGKKEKEKKMTSKQEFYISQFSQTSWHENDLKSYFNEKQNFFLDQMIDFLV